MPDQSRAPGHRRLPPLPLALLTLALAAVQGAWAQSAPALPDEPPLVLRRSPQLTENILPRERSQRPSIVQGDRISGRPDLETTVEGNASLRRGDTVIRADRLNYDQPQDLATAEGDVRVNQAGNIYEGPRLQLKLETFEGFFDSVRYQLLTNGAHGTADRVDFVDSDRTIARRATYTTCRREDDQPGWKPAWFLSAENLRTDSAEGVGVAENVQLHFMGMSSPALPSVSFPLDDQRKSGILPPVIGMDSVNGLELTLPYYWNIAPNRDATFTPSVMSKRGINIANEFRYLEKDYSGEVRFDLMPDDQLRNRDRWGLWLRHRQNFNAGTLGMDTLSANLSVDRVSDDDYWRDFTRTPTLTSRQLSADGTVNWSKGDWSGRLFAQKWQTLTYTEAPITPAYDRLPQLTANYALYDWNGFDFSFNNELTRFSANSTQQGQPNADRLFSQVQLSRPFVRPGYYVTPKLTLSGTSYSFDGPLSNGATSANRTVPTFSLDTGMTFERETSLFGKAYTQTLEPRAFFVNTPYRDQSTLPVYDTAKSDLSLASLFTENEFTGNDRISATKAVTLGVTSRLIDPDTGFERARFGIAQRRRLSDQLVTLPGGTASTDRASDVVTGAQININPQWSVEGAVQYNPQIDKSERRAITARYTPGPYRSLSASYRYQDDRISVNNSGYESIDLGWQWPLNDLWGDKGSPKAGGGLGGGRWYAVGRVNYSLRDKVVTDAVMGVEYDGCCYIGRVVLEKVSTGVATATKRIMFQIEFMGFTSLGTSPMRTLQTNVPRYRSLREPTLAPSRFTNYE